MLKKFCFIVFVVAIIGFVFVPAAKADLPGSSQVDPLVVTDPLLVPSDADFLTDGCVVTYSWSVSTNPDPEGTEFHSPPNTTYYAYVDDRKCEFIIHPKITVIDRCGWRRDIVRVKYDDRFFDIYVEQVTKRRWRISMIARDGYVIVKPNRYVDRPWSHEIRILENRPC